MFVTHRERRDRIGTVVRERERAALSMQEFAAQLGVSKDTVIRAIARGEVKTVKFGRRVLVPMSELERTLRG
jgi:excisionase family DNA binding protein